MANRQRLYLAKLLYEVTIRTLGGHFWLRPDPACRAIIDGVFGKALALYTAVRLYAYDAQSNHLHYLCSADDDPEQLPLFIDYIHGNSARQLNDLRGREGVFWGRRGSVSAVLDGDARICGPVGCDPVPRRSVATRFPGWHCAPIGRDPVHRGAPQIRLCDTPQRL